MAAMRLMTIRFDLPIRRSDVPFFRGAVIRAAGTEHTVFHNHVGSGFAYHYPLIQYRTSAGKAAIICINDGVEQVQALFNSRFLTDDLILNGVNRGKVDVEDVRVREYALTCLETPVTYHIGHWLPLNQKNYREWQDLESADARRAKLEHILTGNIISFAKGVGWQIEKRFGVAIVQESIVPYPCLYKGQRLISFSLDFSAELFLPPGIGLGKGASVNHGVLSQQR